MSRMSDLKNGSHSDTDAGIAPGAVESAETRRRRFVYNGEPGNSPSEFMTRGNRPLKRRKKSPSNIVALLVIISGLTVFYVWNKITVNHLAADVKELSSRLTNVESMNEVYRAEINRKSNLDKITKLAGERSGMVFASEQPVWFEVENYVPRDPADEN